jgi:hypothetical protein
MEFIQIYAKATEVVKAKDALKLIEELKAAGAKLTVEQYEVAIEAVAGVFDKIEVENDLKVMSPNGYDLTGFCKLIESQCPPSLLASFCTHSQAELARLMGYIDKAQIQSDCGSDIWELFNGITASLSLSAKFLGSIYDVIVGDNLPILEGEEAEKFKAALIFANNTAFTSILESLKAKFDCKTNEELAKLMNSKSPESIADEIN